MDKRAIINGIRKNRKLVRRNTQTMIERYVKLGEGPRPEFAKENGILNMGMVNCTYLILVCLKYPEGMGYSDCLEMLRQSFNNSVSQPRPFSQNEFITSKNSIICSPFRKQDNRNLIRLNIPGPPFVESVNDMITSFCHVVETSGMGIEILFSRIYRTNSVFVISVDPKIVTKFSNNHKKMKNMDCETSDVTFPGFMIKNKETGRGVSNIKLFDIGEINFLGVELSSFLKFLPTFLK